MKPHVLISTLLLLPLTVLLAWSSQPDPDKLEKQRCPRPTEFALVFSYGYAGDKMPTEDERFEDLLKKIKDAQFNVIHCTYTEKRLALCKKQGIKMMVDLLEEAHHVFKNSKEAQALCEKLRNHPDVWGYNIWNDGFGKSTEGRRRDINNVRQWDPTHPAYCGTYRTIGMKGLTNPDIFGYYDFHWKRGISQHFPHLLAYSNWARERDARFYTWLSCTSGQPGKGNYNRSLYSANTGIAFGLKGILWFLANDMMDMKTQQWTEIGRDIIKVHKEIAPLSKELAKLGNPVAIYSTSITRTVNNDPLPEGKKEMMPPGLDGRAFPKDFWIRPDAGEFVLGVFHDEQKRDLVYLANHNAYAGHEVSLIISDRKQFEMFDCQEGRWEKLKVEQGRVRMELQPGGGMLLRVSK
jgi:hypothetical protein